jgi:GNAT superfamily N-acetyltransferase
MQAGFTPEIQIREVTPKDAAAVARLAGELGYPCSVEAMCRRIESLQGRSGKMIYVACFQGDIAGWIDICTSYHLAADPRVEIAGLVVDSSVRSRGIGKLLVAKAEQWAREQGLTSMLVRSRVAREDAHRFYLREGYTRTKTSAVFAKDLS